MGVQQIINPYRFSGIYRKAQLHLHTSASIDVLEKIPVEQTIRRYKEAGYTFSVITDHDRVTSCSELNDAHFIAIPGIEETVVKGFWPLGKHLIRIGATVRQPLPNKASDECLWAPAHPNWPGNFWTGFWKLKDLNRLSNLNLIEIYNRHSATQKDVALWHRLLTERGPSQPVWGIAVDDTDNGTPLDLGWIMVKTDDISVSSFMRALQRGSFYATCGPQADFGVAGLEISITTPEQATIRFINSSSHIVAEVRDKMASYFPETKDGFIRIEVQNRHGKTAWSQPFFVVSTP